MAPKRKPFKILPGVQASIGLEVAYRKRLDALIEAMHKSLYRWLLAQYRDNPPELAQDASPAKDLRKEMRRLAQRWQSRFDETAPKLADYFAQAVTQRSSKELAKILADGGISVQFKLSRPVNDILQATIGANVSLIKSIAEEHLSDVEGIVMRSVQEGRDAATLAKQLEQRYGLTKKRAALIARDQNNKATSAITRARQLEVGITQARWVHSGAGKHPRPDHIAYSAGQYGGPIYDIRKGALISGEYIFPGQLINCRCFSKPVIQGFS